MHSDVQQWHPPSQLPRRPRVQCVRKQYLVTAEERDSAVREVEIHRSLGPAPPRIVPLFDAYEDAQHVYLVMQAAAGGDLASYVRAKCVRQFSEIQVRAFDDGGQVWARTSPTYRASRCCCCCCACRRA